MTRSFTLTLAALLAASVGFAGWVQIAAAPLSDDTYLDRPAPPLTVPAHARIAVFAGGCFWGTEEAFRSVPGVLATQTGYTGGTVPHPTYETSHQKNSGYVEATKIVYDPAKVTYETLLATFFSTHDPTVPRPGSSHSSGHAYRSFVFAQDIAQTRLANSVIVSLNKRGRFAFPITTRVRSAAPFYPAEQRHQHYYAKRNQTAKCLL